MSSVLQEVKKEQGLAVYVHWPFCLSLCPYCDFNRYLNREVDTQLWLDSLCKELRFAHGHSSTRTVSSIFFGGGTPSLMPPFLVEGIIDTVERLWGVSKDVEVTLEANPSSSEASKFADIRKAGCNRLSLGVQSLRNDGLQALGRKHSVAEALKALAMAQKVFPRVSFDLIYTRPEQTLEDWRTELAEAFSYGTSHLSLYQLTLEKGTVFYKLHQQGRLKLPDLDESADFYATTQSFCAKKGFESYEVSNYARGSHACYHNLTYWRYQPYVGVGPGAHGRLPWGSSYMATRGAARPKAWLDLVKEKGHGYEGFEKLTSDDMVKEYLVMGLRLTEGVDRLRLQTMLKRSFDDAIFAPLIGEGLVTLSQQKLALTCQGRQVLNSVAREIVTILAIE